MKILAHRGTWTRPEEQNTLAALRASVAAGHGIEFDVRDLDGDLVISHDPPRAGAMSFAALLDEIAGMAHASQAPLGINIKSDGLAEAVQDLLARYDALNAFVFDMSVPDMRHYLRLGVPVLTRISDVETEAAYFDAAGGVWLDALDSEARLIAQLDALLPTGKAICVVSSELHKRPHQALWDQLKPHAAHEGLMLCTDFPDAAAQFFNGETP